MLAISAILMAAATTTTALTPKGPWVLDGEEDLCMLQREYAGGAGNTTLAFKPLLDLHDMELYVVTDDKSTTQQTGDATVTLAPGDRTFKGTYFSVAVPDKKLRYTRITIDHAILTSMKDGDIMSIAAKPIASTFVISRPEKALPPLNECIASLEKSWGVDPESKAAVATQLQGNPGRYFGADDYPKEALRKGIYGRVVALLNVGASGKVENCRIVSSAGKELNEGTCTAAMRVRFTPARDSAGKTVASAYFLPVLWVLPGQNWR